MQTIHPIITKCQWQPPTYQLIVSERHWQQCQLPNCQNSHSQLMKLKFVYLAHSADRRASTNTEVPDYKNIENKGKHSPHHNEVKTLQITLNLNLCLMILRKKSANSTLFARCVLTSFVFTKKMATYWFTVWKNEKFSLAKKYFVKSTL